MHTILYKSLGTLEFCQNRKHSASAEKMISKRLLSDYKELFCTEEPDLMSSAEIWNTTVWEELKNRRKETPTSEELPYSRPIQQSTGDR